MELQPTRQNFVQDKVSLQKKTAETSPQTSLRKDAAPIEKKAEKEVSNLQVNKYLKLIQQLESKVKAKDINKDTLQTITQSLETKIESLQQSERQNLFRTKQFKALEIKEGQSLNDLFLAKLTNEKEASKVFDFLKSKEFLASLKADKKAITYNKAEILTKKGKDPILNMEQALDKKPSSVDKEAPALADNAPNRSESPAEPSPLTDRKQAADPEQKSFA